MCGTCTNVEDGNNKICETYQPKIKIREIKSFDSSRGGWDKREGEREISDTYIIRSK